MKGFDWIFKVTVIFLLTGILISQIKLINTARPTVTPTLRDVRNAKTKEERKKIQEDAPITFVTGNVRVSGIVSVDSIYNQVDITGSVDINNSELDVNVTNYGLDVNVTNWPNR